MQNRAISRSQPFFSRKPLPRKQRDLGEILEDFETFSQVLERRGKACTALWRGELDHHIVAHKLRWRCRKGARCGSPICPVCMRRFRRWFYGEVCALQQPKGDLFAATLIPPLYRYPPGQLHRLSLLGMKDSLRQHFNRSGLGHVVAFGAVDISFNEDREKEWLPHWQAHLHIVFQGCSREEFKARLRRYYPTDDRSPKPIDVDPVRNPERQISYAIKPYFERRVSYVKDGVRDTRKPLPLKPDQLREITLFMSKTEMMDRVFLFNCRRYGSSIRRS